MSLAAAWPTTVQWVDELARAAAQLAGLTSEQVPGLRHLFMLVYERGYEDGYRDHEELDGKPREERTTPHADQG